jgi:glycosyltransferase involved in cell wall biosynthesis
VSPPRPRRLRVACVYRNFNRSGSIPSMFAWKVERLARDEDVTAVCSAATRDPTSAPVAFETVEPLVRGSGRLRYALECGTFARRATRLLARAADRFDVVHVEGFAARRADLVSVHAVRPAELEHYFSNVRAVSTLRRRLAPYLLRPQGGVVMSVERSLFHGGLTPYCLVPSAAIKSDLERVYGVPGELVEVLHYAIETARFRHDPAARAALRSQLGVPEGRLVLALIGDGFERKGLRRAIAALARARTDAELWALGDESPKPYRDLARRMGVGDRVRFLGRRPHAEISAWYAACDVVVLLSQQDAWGQSVAEGLAAGRVVVASRFAGAYELLDPGRSGFVLAGKGAPAELAALIDGPLSNPEARAEIGARAAAAAAPLDHDAIYLRYREAHHRAYALRVRRLGTATPPRP